MSVEFIDLEIKKLIFQLSSILMLVGCAQQNAVNTTLLNNSSDLECVQQKMVAPPYKPDEAFVASSWNGGASGCATLEISGMEALLIEGVISV